MRILLRIAISNTNCTGGLMSRKPTLIHVMSDNVYGALPGEPFPPATHPDPSIVSENQQIQAIVIENETTEPDTTGAVLRKRSHAYRPHQKRHRWRFVFVSRSTNCTHALIRWHQCQRCGLVSSDASWKRFRIPECPGDTWTLDAMPATGEEARAVMPDLRHYRGPRPPRGV